MTFEELETRIRAYPGGFESGVGAGSTEINAEGMRLGLQIRGGYRRFLEIFGWMEIAYSEIYGIGEEVPQHLKLGRIIESERSEMHPRLPRYLLAFSNNGAGDLYCLDTTSLADDPPVVLWIHEKSEDQVPEPAAASFSDWFVELLNTPFDS